MIAVISPAKTLDFTKPVPSLPTTEPVFKHEAHRLADAAARLSEKDLSSLMDISDKLAELNVARYRNFNDLPERPAIFAFAGDVYAGFEAKSLDDEAILYAQNHLRILSGLYGLLRPLDMIRPYRLEMGTKWAPRHGDLYSFWGDRIAKQLEQDLGGSGTKVIINIASKEYWGTVQGQLDPEIRVINIDFREEGPSGLRFNTFAGKKARGMMARYMCEHRIDDPEGLKGFGSDGYSFDANVSDENVWRFTRA